MNNLYDVEAHVYDMTTAGAIVSGTGITLQGIAEVSTVQVVITEIIVTPPVNAHQTPHGSHLIMYTKM